MANTANLMWFSAIVPPVVTSGLLVYLDAANIASYSGSGSAWNDLSGNGFNATLLGTTIPTFNSANGGGIVFGASSDQRADCGTSATLALIDYTVCAWVNTNSYGGSSKGRIINRDNGTSSGYAMFVDNINVVNGISMDNADGTGTFLSVANVTSLSTWVHFSVTFANAGANGTAIIYKNGVNIGSGTVTSPTAITGNMLIGNRQPLDRNFDGTIAVAMIYNRALSSSEILQNFNVNRNRYGL
jgi:Concanavalin A-like lectin/glucanases superfamily